MKTTIKLIAIIAMVLTSCNKKVEVCVDGNMTPSEVGTYKYTWCGQNADQIIWKISGGSFVTEQTYITQEGQALEINVDLFKKGQYNLTVKGSNKKKDNTMSYQINVGEYTPRVELYRCSGGYYPNDPLNFKAYAYLSLVDLQNDLRNNTKTNVKDSVVLKPSLYYNNQLHNVGSEVLAGSFTNLPEGNYYVYVSESNGKNNLLKLTYYHSPLLFVSTQSQGDFYNGLDPIANPGISDANSAFAYNLFTKSFLFTELKVNGAVQTINPCNADDFIIFNLDNTWTLDVGNDNCSGGQTTSLGTINNYYECSPQNYGIQMTVNSGSLLGAQGLNFSYVSDTQIKLSYGTGGSTIEQTFTAQ